MSSSGGMIMMFHHGWAIRIGTWVAHYYEVVPAEASERPTVRSLCGLLYDAKIPNGSSAMFSLGNFRKCTKCKKAEVDRNSIVYNPLKASWRGRQPGGKVN